MTSITGSRSGTYSYDANGNMTQRDGDPITWYSYNKPNRINYGSDYAQFSYGPTRARFKQVAVNSGVTATTYYVGAHFEKETKSGVTEYRHNIFAGNRAVAVYTRPTSGSITTRYLHRDHLGSVVSVTDESGNVDQTFSYDAFGKRRYPNWSADPTDSQFSVPNATERGYTGHEHLDSVRLVHMNGRVQDPIIGRMVSADPFVPDPSNSQAFNRYSYVYNNPMAFIDPSGFDPDEGERRFTFRDFCRLFGGCEDFFNPPGSITERDIDDLDRREDYEDCVNFGICSNDRSNDGDSQDGSDSWIFGDVNVDWRFVTSVAWEIAGWGLIGIDVANTMLSPGPDVGLLGATFVSGARTLRSGVPNAVRFYNIRGVGNLDLTPGGVSNFLASNARRLQEKLGAKIGQGRLPFARGRAGFDEALSTVARTLRNPTDIVGPFATARGGNTVVDVFSRETGFTVRIRADGTFDTLIQGPTSRIRP
ncbi:RHS repeat domain-containing protein [Lentisalinibacter orientalis]|uniref:RHS repeat domain-containing protein n=1 Tax=Lentisalinibacter orientalis TaxID=2992241 RepID=UPI0038652E2D